MITTERTFRPFEPEQMLLLPPSLKEWLPSGHLVYFILDLVPKLELKDILKSYGGVTRKRSGCCAIFMRGGIVYK